MTARATFTCPRHLAIKRESPIVGLAVPVRLVAAPQPSSSTVTVIADKSDVKPAVLDLDKLIDTSDVLLAHYSKLTNHNAPQTGRDWYERAYELHNSEHFRDAIEGFKQAISHGYRVEDSMYNIACGYARKGDVASGMQWLQKAIEEGFDSIDKLDDDSDIDNLRGNARFADLKKMAHDLRLQPTNNFLGNLLKDDSDWADALPRFRSMTQRYPNLGRSWFSLGFAALQAGQNQESISSFKHALDMNYRTTTTMYNLACAYARSNQNDTAIEWLQKARSAGFELGRYIDNDDDLNSLRSDPRFRQLRQEVHKTDEN